MGASFRKPLIAGLVASVGLMGLATPVPANADTSYDPAWQFPAGKAGTPGHDVWWADCTGPSDQYCVESATLDGNPINTATGTYRVSVSAVNFPQGGADIAVRISHYTGTAMVDEAPAEGSAAKVVIRVGQFQQALTSVTGKNFATTTTSTPTGNTIAVEGTATRIDWLANTNPNAANCSNEKSVPDCGGQTTHADTTTYEFKTELVSSPTLPADMWGLTTATNAQTSLPNASDFSRFDDFPLNFSLTNPGLSATGDLVTSWLTASMPVSYFVAHGLPANADAVKVVRLDSYGKVNTEPKIALDGSYITLSIDSIDTANSQWRLVANAPVKPGAIKIKTVKKKRTVSWKSSSRATRAAVQYYQVIVSKSVKHGKKTKLKKVKSVRVKSTKYVLPKLAHGKYTVSVSASNIGGLGAARNKTFNL